MKALQKQINILHMVQRHLAKNRVETAAVQCSGAKIVPQDMQVIDAARQRKRAQADAGTVV